MRLLLVEDHGDTTRIISRLLGMEGHKVDIAGDVAGALDLAAGRPFDLLISDLGLPDGSGLDLLRAMRRRGQAMPAIALSGFGQERDLQHTRQAGFQAHLIKPVSVDRLLATHAGLRVDTRVITTSGDRQQDRPLPEIGGKGLFTEELERALLDGAIDLAVHSTKDLPTDLKEGLSVLAYPPREDPRDAWYLSGERLDTTSFKADLASWSAGDVAAERARLGIVPNAAIGVFCGSLYPDKRLELLVDSADLIRKQVPEFSLVVIGDGPSMPQLREAAVSRPWLHLLGVRKGREKALYFRMGDVVLNPGAVGLHIVDSFCSGLVMVTTRSARHGPEVVYLRDGENGVYGGETPETYSRAVLDVIQNTNRLQCMKTSALADSERYTLANMVLRFADGIEAALGR